MTTTGPVIASPPIYKAQPEDLVKEATVAALNKLLAPLLELMFDAGVTVQEFNTIMRDRAVHVAMQRVVKQTGRESKSRVAIMTGLPRSEITKIYRYRQPVASPKGSQHLARRILNAWHENPQFVSALGQPAILPIYGKRKSFERLVDKFGSGIPVRAMLDELTQINAVECLADQKVRAKSRVPVRTGLNVGSIAAAGEQGKNLLETFLHNMRQNAEPHFQGTAQIDINDEEIVPSIRRELANQSTSFINSAISLLTQSQNKCSGKAHANTKTSRAGVTVFYFEGVIHGHGADAHTGEKASSRKNLRRHAR